MSAAPRPAPPGPPGDPPRPGTAGAAPPLPLAAFLNSLAFCGIRPSPRDYLRIQTLLQGRCRWTLPVLRDALASLLASDRDQQRAFLDHFDRFFAVPAGGTVPPEPAPLDLPRALAELRTLIDRPAPSPDLAPAPAATPPDPTPDRPPTRPGPPRWRLPVLMALLLAVLGAAVLYHWPEPVPRLCLDPGLADTGITLGERTAGSESRHPLTLENCGNAPLTLGAHAWPDTDPPDAPGTPPVEPTKAPFRLDPAPAGLRLAPGERLTLGLWFNPPAPADYRARLRLHHDGAGPPVELGLRGQGIAPVESPRPPRNRVYRAVPTIREVRFTPAIGGDTWQLPALLAALTGLLLALVLVRAWHRGRVPEDRPASADPGQPGRFRFGTVGGRPLPRLDQAAAAGIAEAVGHYQSARPGRRLDAAASVRATLAAHGLPSLCFRRRQLVQGLLILEDEETRARAWNPIAAELAHAMPALGIPVLHGCWHGSPLRFRDDAGRVRVLEDLEGAAPGLILLLFTDGRHLDPAGRRATLEALARWPAVAWLDPREPRARAPGEGPPPGSEVPIYPATPAGILDAVRLHRGEPRTAAPPPPHPPRPALPLPAALERHLGEALDWAQDCALLHPTVPLGLAEALRRRFHPGVPAAAIERLHTLPGTSATAAGLRLSDPVRRVLRKLAAARRDPADRQRVLAFVLERIEAARPGADASDLMRIGWELAREKVRFEQDPANDCRRLAELERHPALGAAVHDWLRDFSEPGVPFLARPTRRDAAVRLARFTGNPLGLARDRLYWLGWPGRVLAGALLAGGLGLAGYGLHQAMTPPAAGAEWRWAGDPAPGETLVWAEHHAGDDWPADSPALPLAGLEGQRPVLGRTYRLHLLGQGHDGRGQTVAIDEPGTYRVVLEARDLSAPCIEEVPDLPLRIQRCPAPDGETDHVAPGWRQRLAGRVPGGPGAPRQLSLGLVLGEDGPGRDLTDRLFETGSLDRLYRVDTADPAAAARALAWLGRELGPMAGHIQVLAWRAAGIGAADLPGARRIDLGAGAGRADRLLGLLGAGEGEVIEEAALLAGLGLAPGAAVGAGEGVRLVRTVGAGPVGGPGAESEFRLLRAWKGHEGAICLSTNCLAFSPDGRLLASGGNDKLVRLWAVQDVQQVHALKSHANVLYAVAFSPDGSLLASASLDGTVKVWSVGDGGLVKTLDTPSGIDYSVAFSSDGHTLASSGFMPSNVHVWNSADWSLAQTLVGHKGDVNTVSFNPSGDSLASAGSDGTVKLWSRPDGHLMQTLVHRDESVRTISG